MTISNADYDRDGDLDYYFTNIGCNVLAQSDGGRFVDVARDVGAAVCDTEDPSIDFAFEPANPDSADPDDVAIAAFQQRYVANPARPALTSWAGVFFDFDHDHDGWEDLFVPNGQIRNVRRVYQDAWAQPNALLHNVATGDERAFAQPAADSGLAFGLGGATLVERVTVRWPPPSATVDQCTNVPVNQRLLIHEGDCP